MLEEINKISKEALEYLEIQLDLIKVHAVESLSGLFTKIATVLVTSILLAMLIIFVSIAAGYYFAEILDSYPLGFLIVGAFYFLLLTLFLLFGKRIVEKSIIRAMLRIVFPKSADGEKE